MEIKSVIAVKLYLIVSRAIRILVTFSDYLPLKIMNTTTMFLQ